MIRPASYIVNSACLLKFPVRQPSFSRNNRYNDGYFYVQDAWKVTPRLTVNLGVRWEYYGVQHNADPSLDSNFYLGTGGQLVPADSQWHGTDCQSESGGRAVGTGQKQLGAACGLCL